jgi:hypothetical protein
MKNTILSLCFVFAVVIAISATTGEQPKPATKPEETFKNLKVLPKDISKDALDSIMHEFSNSLDVHCTFCHARWKDTTKKGLDFASDEKDNKNTAREMFTMTSYVNTHFFNFDHSTKPDTIHLVICYTCHRGMKEPDEEVLMKELQKIAEDKKKDHQMNHQH